MEHKETDHRPLRILHLDDHRLFLDGMRVAILSRYPKATIEALSSNEEALTRLRVLLVGNERPDFIVTDFNHLGGNGLEFATEAKLLCEKLGAKIPIIMVTMRQERDTIPDGLESSPLDGFLAKASSTDDILYVIENLLPAIA